MRQRQSGRMRRTIGRLIVTFAANSAFSRDIAHVLHPYTNLKNISRTGR
jgi:hypothetical protein